MLEATRQSLSPSVSPCKAFPTPNSFKSAFGNLSLFGFGNKWCRNWVRWEYTYRIVSFWFELQHDVCRVYFKPCITCSNFPAPPWYIQHCLAFPACRPKARDWRSWCRYKSTCSEEGWARDERGLLVMLVASAFFDLATCSCFEFGWSGWWSIWRPQLCDQADYPGPRMHGVAPLCFWYRFHDPMVTIVIQQTSTFVLKCMGKS